MSAEPVGAYVLDSFALLAHLQDEAGAPAVERILEGCARGTARAWLSVVNFGEIAYIVERERGIHQARRAIAAIDALPVDLAAAGRELTLAAAHVKARHTVSYADAFAVALALSVGGRVVTGDPEFERVEALVEVVWLKRS